jgi:hypothetical protein
MLRSTLQTFEEDFGKQLFDQLSPETTAPRCTARIALARIGGCSAARSSRRSRPVSIETLEEELGKLALLRSLGLPPNLFGRISLRIVKGYRRRVAVEEVHELLLFEFMWRTSALIIWHTKDRATSYQACPITRFSRAVLTTSTDRVSRPLIA